MFGPMFDWTVAAVLIVITVLLFIGKGDFVLGESVKKKGVEDKKKYERVMGCFTLFLALIEVIFALTPDNTFILMVGILAALAALICVGNYAKKHK